MRGKKEEIPELRHSLACSRARLTYSKWKQPAYYFTSFFTGSFPKTDLFSLFLAPSDSHIWREKCFHHENVAIVKTSEQLYEVKIVIEEFAFSLIFSQVKK